LQNYNFGIDIDGTLFEGNPFYISTSEKLIRKHIINSNPKKGIEVILNKDLNITLITGRNEKYRRLTIECLNKYKIPFVKLVMMPDESYGSSFDEKIYLNFKLTSYLENHIHFALDDDIKVVNQYNIRAQKVNGDLREAFNNLFKDAERKI